jgi:hypothetical protein
LLSDSDLCAIWSGLSRLDVASVSDSDVFRVSCWWCHCLQLSKLYTLLLKPKVSFRLVSSAFLCADVAVSLHLRLRALRLPDLEPVLCLIGCSDDIFNDAAVDDFPVREPRRIGRSWSQFLNSVHFLEHFPVGDFCVAALRIRLFQSQVPLDSDIFGFLAPFQTVYHFPSEVGKDPAIDNPKFNLLCLKYSELLFDFRFDRRIVVKGEKLGFLSTGAAADLFPDWQIVELLDIDFTKNATTFLSFCLADVVKVDESAFERVTDAAVYCNLIIYAVYVNTRSEFLTKFARLEFPEKFQPELSQFREAVGLSETVEQLLQKKTEARAARLLWKHRPSLLLLNTEFPRDRLLRIFLSPEHRINTEIDEFLPAILFRAIRLEQQPPKGFIREILEGVRRQLSKTPDIGFADCPPPDSTGLDQLSIPLPISEGDFFRDEPLPHSIICTWVTYLCVLLYEPDDDAMIILVADLSLNWEMNWLNEGRLSQFLESFLPFSFVEHRRRLKTDRILNVIRSCDVRDWFLVLLNGLEPFVGPDQHLLIAVLRYLLQEDDEQRISHFVRVYQEHLAATRFCLDSKEQDSLLRSLLLTRSIEIVSSFTSHLDANVLFKLLAEEALRDPAAVVKIIDAIPRNLESMKVFIEALPEFSGMIHPDFVALLRSVLSQFPVFPITCHRPSSAVIPVSWHPQEEQLEKEEVVEPIVDPWAAPTMRKRCPKAFPDGAPGFWCYTCRIVHDRRICLSCADHCHRSHVIVPASSPMFLCCCGDRCRATSDFDSRQKKAKIDPPVTISNTSFISLFKSLSASEVESVVREAPVVCRLSGDIASIELQQLPTKMVKRAATFQSNDHSPQVVSVAAVEAAIHSNSHHFQKRTAVVPMQLAAVCGAVGNLLVVGSGQMLRAYSVETFQQVAEYEIPFPVFQISVCPIDPSVFAASSLYQVSIYTILEVGIQRLNDIELMLDDLGDHIFINTIDWVPFSVLHLAVVCNAFVKIYDVPTDCLAPCLCFMPDDEEFFSSAVFTTREEEPIGLFATSLGRIASQPLTVVDCPMSITNFVNSVTGFPPDASISACEASDLFFVSSESGDLHLYRLSAVLQNGIVCSFRVDLPEKSPWLFVWATDAKHFFTNPSSGMIMSLEFTDSCFELSVLNRVQSCLSAVVINNKVFTVSGVNGALMSLEPCVDEDVDDVSAAPPDISLVAVPNHFWCLSQVSTECISVRSIYEDTDCSFILRHSRLVLNSGARTNVLRFKSSNSAQLIVGFRVFLHVGRRYAKVPWIAVNGRRTPVKEPRPYVLALRPDEVASGQTHAIEFGPVGDAQIGCDGIDVFVIAAGKLARAESPEFDWLTDGGDLFDFTDATQHTERSHIFASENLCTQMLKGDAQLAADVVEWIVEMIYARPNLTALARRIIVKCGRGEQNVVAAWAAGIRRVIVEKKVHPEMWKVLWRDIALMPPDIRSNIIGTVWDSDPQFAGIFPAVAAFFSEG